MITSLALAFSPFAIAQQADGPLSSSESTTTEALASKAALRAFERDAGGSWIVQWHAATGTPSAIYGTGLAIDDWRENSLEEARRHAEQLLRERRDVLGLGTSTFREIIGARMGRTWSFTYDQYFRGLPVIEGRADVRTNMRGVVAMIGSRAWPVPADFDIAPAIDTDVATGIAWGSLQEAPRREDAGTAQPRLVIWGDIAATELAPFFLAWEVPVHNVNAEGEGFVGNIFVDAKNGRVLHQQSTQHNCGFAGCRAAAPATASETHPEAPAFSVRYEPVDDATRKAMPTLTTVTVMAWTRTGNDAFSALQNIGLPGVVVNVPGVGTRTTDDQGQFEIDITQAVTISINGINGEHHATVAGPSAPTGSVTVSPGVNATIQLLSASASTAQAAHTTASYWTNKSNEWARSILGNTSQLNTASSISIEVNIASSCNAVYGGNQTRFFSAGGGCANTAFSTVVAHEWGHGLDDRYGGVANSNAEGLSEGWGDIIGMYQVDSPLLGSGFSNPGQPLRNGNNNRVWPFSVGNAPHPAGEVWMGFAWRYREALRSAFGTPQAIAISNDTLITSIVADATTREDAVREVFIADDDDGNLLNGTPHYDQLESAALQKGIPYPEIEAVTISHNPLTTTTLRMVPREVIAVATPGFGSVTAVRVVYDAGQGLTTRTMTPTALNNRYLAMLPALDSGDMAYHIEVDHSSGVTVRDPETGEHEYTINGGTFTGFYTEGFETGGPAWTHAAIGGGQDDWQVGDPAGKSGTSQGVAWSDPQSAFAGNNCYSNDLGNFIGGQNWNGSYRANTNNFLRSPIIDCSGKSNVTLRFRRWLTIEDGIYDQATLVVNGQQVWQNPSNGVLRDTNWQLVEYSLPMADNNPSVQLEWRLQSDGALHLGGWNIDDVQLGELTFEPLDVSYALTPAQAQGGQPLTMTVKTQGGSRPFLVGMGDTQGPIITPDIPLLWIGGNIAVAGSSTDANGDFSLVVSTPTVSSMIGVSLYSQVLTLDQTFTQFVASNRWINLLTQ